MDIIKLEQILYDEIPENTDDLFIQLQDILKDLPIECQIDEDNFKKTCYNLYNYFLNDETINKIPEPFYSDYVTIYALKVFRQIAHGKMINELKEKSKSPHFGRISYV
jgi:hypothetical protein